MGDGRGKPGGAAGRGDARPGRIDERGWSARSPSPFRATPSRRVEIFNGVVDGSVADGAARRAGGFGYDPIFLLPEGRTTAELAEPEKDRISHRGQGRRRSVAATRSKSSRSPTSPSVPLRPGTIVGSSARRGIRTVA